MKFQELFKSIARPPSTGQIDPQVFPSITLRTLVFFLAAVVVLAFFHLLITAAGLGNDNWIHKLFFLGWDNNIPAWYSSILLSVAALLAFQCSELARAFGPWDRWIFLMFCALLLLMSCDEIARIHEVLPVIITEGLGLKTHPIFDGHKWVVLGGPIVFIILAGFFFILTRVLKRHKPSLILLGLGFSCIILGGVLLEALTVLIPHGLLKMLEILAEESLEMIGTLLVCASLICWRDHVLASRILTTNQKDSH